MTRRKFTLAWGRKQIFGISLPLTLAFGLIYLKSFILPETTTEWLYFITTYIGHFGLLNVILYFVFYCPVILLFPSYYISRFWSVFLMIALNMLVLIDALVFSSTHYHLYSFIFDIFLQSGIKAFQLPDSVFIVAGLLALGLLTTIWIRGEILWRYMQGRFSNPVKNWYLFIILICFVIGNGLLYYSPVSAELAEVFPLKKKFFSTQGTSRVAKLYYPKSSITCSEKHNPNVVMILIDDWAKADFTKETMPGMSHYSEHGINFTSHTDMGLDKEGGLFSLFYSLPTQVMAQNLRPSLFQQELDKRGYEKVEKTNILDIATWFKNRSEEDMTPYFIKVSTRESLEEIDSAITQLMALPDTHVIITAAHSSTSEEIPLIWITPDRKEETYSHVTTTYDVVPTLMKEMWNCKKVFEGSLGHSLLSKDRDWVLKSIPNGFEIIDFKNQNRFGIRSGKIFSEKPLDDYRLIFKVLNLLTEYRRPTF